MYLIDLEKFQNLLIVHQKPEDAIIMKAYMKNYFEFYGIKSEERKAHFKACIFKSSDPDELKKIVKKLWQSPQREMQYAALDLLDKAKNNFDHTWLIFIESLVLTKSWWDTVDHIAAHYLGKILSKMNKQEQWSICERWIESENLWLQRCSILYQLKYKEKTDFEILKQAIWGTIHNKDFFIRKAAGWALREYSKSKPQEVRFFFEEHGYLLDKLTCREGMKYI
jgi:3-methyladenine DNA glycosylase AlkD